MPAYNPRLFRHLPLLEAIRPSLLVPLFHPYAAFLSELGATLPEIDQPDALDHKALHAALMSPADKAPEQLVEALYLIDETANEEGEIAIRKELEAKLPRFVFDPTWSNAEFAIAVWLENPQIIEDAHARQNAFQPRKFVSWRAVDDFVPDLPSDITRASAEISQRLEAVFLEHDTRRHGGGQPPRRFRVFHYPQASGVVRFLIRHAGKLQNAPSVRDDGDSYLALFRPEIYDVVIFASDARELRINAGSKLEQSAYARAFGEKLCGNPDTFAEVGKYTLEPLRMGPESLVCQDVVGIKRVRLTEVALHHGGEQDEYEIRRARDIFKTNFFRDGGFPDGVPFKRATFKVTFEHTERVRKVIITPPRFATFMRDSDGDLIEQWLIVRGFTLEGESANVAGAPRQA